MACAAGHCSPASAPGLAIGLVNGLLVAYLRLPSFLVTLATMGLFAGVARSLTNLRSIPVTDCMFHRLLRLRRLLGVPSLIWWTIVAVAIGHFVYRETRFGAHVLATGDNARAAQRLRHHACRASGCWC